MSTVSQYRIYCITDQKWEYIWNTTEPATCPTNTTHEVNLNSISKINEISQSSVEIKQETILTGGHTRLVTKTFDVNPGTTGEYEFSFPYGVNISGGFMQTRDSQEKDLISIYVAPNTLIGVLTSNCSVGATSINVSSTVIQNAFVGGFITLSDSTNISTESEIVSIDSVNNILCVDTPIDLSFDYTSPTYIKFSVLFVHKSKVGLGGLKTIGTLTLNTSYIPANTKIKLVYSNNSSEIQSPNFQVQYLY